MTIRMMEYNEELKLYRPAGEINPSEWPLADALASFIKDCDIDVSIFLRPTLILGVSKNLRSQGIKKPAKNFINNNRHPLSTAGYDNFGYGVQKGSEMLLLAGNPQEIDMPAANIILRFLFGTSAGFSGKEKQRYILTYMNIVA